MELRELTYFVAIAEECSFTRGAARVGVVQSAASAAVSRLEREFAHELFSRNGRSIELTHAGQVLLTRARTVLADARLVREDMQLLSGELMGTVTLGTVLTTGDLDLAAALTDFHRRHPRVAVCVRLSAGPESDHARRVLDGTFDLALLPMVEQYPAGVAVVQVAWMQLALVCRQDDPLAHAHGVRYRDIVERTFVDFPAHWGNRAIVEGLFHSENLERTVGIEVVDANIAVKLVQGGVGLAFLPDSVLADHPGLARVDLVTPPRRRRVGLAVANDRPTPETVKALHHVLVAQRSGDTVVATNGRPPVEDLP